MEIHVIIIDVFAIYVRGNYFNTFINFIPGPPSMVPGLVMSWIMLMDYDVSCQSSDKLGLIHHEVNIWFVGTQNIVSQ